MKSPTGEDPSGFINLIDSWEEECCRPISNGLGGGDRRFDKYVFIITSEIWNIVYCIAAMRCAQGSLKPYRGVAAFCGISISGKGAHL
jgi:hypothetical protein